MRRGGVRPERGQERRSCCGLLYKEARSGGRMSRRETVAAAEGKDTRSARRGTVGVKLPLTYINSLSIDKSWSLGAPGAWRLNKRDDKSKILSNKRCLVRDGSKEGEDGREEKDTF